MDKKVLHQLLASTDETKRQRRKESSRRKKRQREKVLHQPPLSPSLAVLFLEWYYKILQQIICYSLSHSCALSCA